MFKDRTLFVVGAGASSEVDMPTGDTLAISIRSLVDLQNDSPISRANFCNEIRKKYNSDQEFNKCRAALNKIRDGIAMSRSIDNCIDMHRDDPYVAEMGKLSIAILISNAEKKSKIYVDPSNIYNRINLTEKSIQETWFSTFAQILVDKIRVDSIKNIGSNISIINFNYDRCLEFYLIDAIHQTFSCSYEIAHDLVSNLEIIHPYGTLGALPNTRPPMRTNGAIPYGTTIDDRLDTWKVAGNLRTYQEQIEDTKIVERIKKAMKLAKQVIFLGFSFHTQNMQLLSLAQGTRPKRVFATGKGIAEFEVQEVKNRIVDLYTSTTAPREQSCKLVQINEGTKCADLMQSNWRNIAES